jgi:tetratricopeptide (TPR) repeat protein
VLGYVDLEGGRPIVARGLYEQILAIAERRGDRLVQAQARGNLALVASYLGDHVAWERSSRECTVLFRDLGHRVGELDAWIALARARQALGDLDGALVAHERARRVAADTGHERRARVAANNLADTLRYAGDLDGAERTMDETDASADANNPLALAFSHLNRGHVTLARGHAARPQLDAARAVAAAHPQPAGSLLDKAILRLERAITAQERGETLLGGECRDDLAPGLRAALEARERG